MTNDELVMVILRAMNDLRYEQQHLEHMVATSDYLTKQGFINAGQTLQRIAANMFVAAGAVKETHDA